MQGSFDKVSSLRVGFLHNWVAGCRLGFQKCNHRSRRRLPHLPKTIRLVAFSSSGQLQQSSQGSMAYLDGLQLDLELFEDFVGPFKDSSRQQLTAQKSHLRSWYGKDGELVSKFPCPDCRGRGYIICPKCDAGTLEPSCTGCSGTGLKTCSHCLGKRAVLVQPVYEIPWEETTASRGPVLQIEDDEIIDGMDIQLAPDRKSKRIYSSPPMEVREKIRLALKSLDARTGSVTRRMRRIHSDPILNAKRIAAIKKAKSTEAARKNISEKMRLYFQEPANRHQRSLSVKGVEFYCSHCGGKGHRRHYCPDLPVSDKTPRSYHCSICGQLGHKRTSCVGVSNSLKKSATSKKLEYKCSICKAVGHNARSCKSKYKQEGSTGG